MASHLNPPYRQSHVCNFSQFIRDIRYVGLTRLLDVKVEIFQLSTMPSSSLRTSSPTSGAIWPLAARCHILLPYITGLDIKIIHHTTSNRTFACIMLSSLSLYVVLTLCHTAMSHATLILICQVSMLRLQTSLISHALWLPHA